MQRALLVGLALSAGFLSVAGVLVGWRAHRGRSRALETALRELAELREHAGRTANALAALQAEHDWLRTGQELLARLLVNRLVWPVGPGPSRRGAELS